MGQALYRKYRSKSLSEIVGQDHIITTLKNALKQGNISHAYLFTGPRGVGKTSIARILAHEINQVPYNEETVHIDIIEIDAASNRRIDEIRDLRDKVHIAPSSAKYKVYIIDEVHMLTREAFNALLKTLEEPPEHAIFILATTEVHKLPETIVSRTQRFTFRPIESGKAVAHLRSIATDEKITISDEALELIADHGDGSFRDSISLLDQISTSGGSIEVDDIRIMLGVAPQAAIEELYQRVQTGTPQTILEYLTSLQEQGYEATHIAKQLSAVLRADLVSGNAGSVATHLLKQLIKVPASSDPTTRLEITLLEANLKQNPESETATPVKAPETPKATAVIAPPQVEKPAVKPTPKAKKAPEAPAAVPNASFDEAWTATLAIVKSKYNTLYGVLRMATARVEGDKVILVCKFAFHQKRLADTKNRAIIGDILYEQLGTPLEITCIVQENAPIEPVVLAQTPEIAQKPALDTISNIFGATEVLES